MGRTLAQIQSMQQSQAQSQGESDLGDVMKQLYGGSGQGDNSGAPTPAANQSPTQTSGASDFIANLLGKNRPQGGGPPPAGPGLQGGGSPGGGSDNVLQRGSPYAAQGGTVGPQPQGGPQPPSPGQASVLLPPQGGQSPQPGSPMQAPQPVPTSNLQPTQPGQWPSKADAMNYAYKYTLAKSNDPAKAKYAAALVGEEYGGPQGAIGDQGTSFGPLQMHFGGRTPNIPQLNNPGLGDELKKMGVDATNPRDWQKATNFGLDRLLTHGPGDWATSANKLAAKGLNYGGSGPRFHGQQPAPGGDVGQADFPGPNSLGTGDKTGPMIIKKEDGGPEKSLPAGETKPLTQEQSERLYPIVNHLTLPQIIQTMRRLKPNASGMEIYETIKAAMPIMNAEAQRDFKTLQQDYRERKLYDQEQQFERKQGDAEQRERDKVTFEDRKQKIAEDMAKLAQEKYQTAKEEWQQKYDQAETRIKQAWQRLDFAGAAKDLKQAQVYVNAQAKATSAAISAAANIADPDLRDKMIAQAQKDLQDARDRYDKLQSDHIEARDNKNTGPGGASVEEKKTEQVGKPRQVAPEDKKRELDDLIIEYRKNLASGHYDADKLQSILRQIVKDKGLDMGEAEKAMNEMAPADGT